MSIPELKLTGHSSLRLCFFLLTFFAISFNLHAQLDGKKLFKAKCGSCHAINTLLTGPALKGVESRVPSREWIYDWVENSAKVIASGDEYAAKVYAENNNTAMTSFPELSHEDIDAILAYVEAPPETPVGLVPGEGMAAADEDNTFAWFIMIILAFMALVLSKAMGTLTNLVREKMGEPILEPIPLGQRLRSRRTITLVILVLFISGSYNLIDNAMKLGLSHEYQPEQPIAFSHKVHAGVNKIDCKYCHSGAEKSRHASIPSLNVCMNCHKAIKEYTGETLWNGKEGTDEIQKIYAAIENNSPIEWVKIHNVPDFVYFNHSQHVAVGKVECQTCHGPIEEMDEVYQFNTLAMGWCVNCHRDTKVEQFASNAYYEMFTEYHEQMKSGELEVVTAQKLGAVECQKCHY